MHTIDMQSQTGTVGTTLSGNTVAVQAGHDITVTGSNIAATQDVALQAKNNINIEAASASTREAHYREEQHSGQVVR